MRRRNLDKAKTTLINYFDNSQKVYHITQLKRLFEENKDEWKLGVRTNFERFVDFLISQQLMKEAVFNFNRRRYTIYYWGENVPKIKIVQSINKDAYFSHYTAVTLHDLTEQLPKILYLKLENVKVNQEAKEEARNALTQEKIDESFQAEPRITHNITEFKDNDINVCLLAGEKTNGLGIIEMTYNNTDGIRITSLERTLIDIAVRPMYAGGVYEVLKAYTRAQSKVSINKLKAMLLKLDFIYPYHQVIGFYLEKSGVYTKNQIAFLEKLEKKYNFYLTHDMKEKEYSKRWKLFYPKGF